MTEQPLLRVKNVSQHYRQGIFQPPKKVLQGIDFELKQGQAIGILGESGAGKSTLARLLCGLESATEGSILLVGKPIANKANRRTHLSVVFQDYSSAINPKMTVLQAIGEPLIAQGSPLKAVEVNVLELLERVGLSADFLSRNIAQLSGGQAQRVNLCRALITRPSLIIFDEAISALDLVSQVQILDLLLELKQQFNLSYLFITHNVQALCYLCDSVLFLEKGNIVEQCEVAKLAEAKSDCAKRLLGAVI